MGNTSSLATKPKKKTLLDFRRTWKWKIHQVRFAINGKISSHNNRMRTRWLFKNNKRNRSANLRSLLKRQLLFGLVARRNNRWNKTAKSQVWTTCYARKSCPNYPLQLPLKRSLPWRHQSSNPRSQIWRNRSEKKLSLNTLWFLCFM